MSSSSSFSGENRFCTVDSIIDYSRCVYKVGHVHTFRQAITHFIDSIYNTHREYYKMDAVGAAYNFRHYSVFSDLLSFSEVKPRQMFTAIKCTLVYMQNSSAFFFLSFLLLLKQCILIVCHF